MEPSLKLISILLIFYLLSGCTILSSSDSKTHDGLKFKLHDDHFVVTNTTGKPVYYFVVDRASTAFILWAPVSTKENEIKPKQKKMFLFEEIWNYSEGAQINFYYWVEHEPDFESINVVVLDPESKKITK